MQIPRHTTARNNLPESKLDEQDENQEKRWLSRESKISAMPR